MNIQKLIIIVLLSLGGVTESSYGMNNASQNSGISSWFSSAVNFFFGSSNSTSALGKQNQIEKMETDSLADKSDYSENILKLVDIKAKSEHARKKSQDLLLMYELKVMRINDELKKLSSNSTKEKIKSKNHELKTVQMHIKNQQGIIKKLNKNIRECSQAIKRSKQSLSEGQSLVINNAEQTIDDKRLEQELLEITQQELADQELADVGTDQTNQKTANELSDAQIDEELKELADLI